MEPGFASTCPRSIMVRSIPRSNAPMLSPERPSSNSLRNISIPVTTVFLISWIPTISTSYPTWTTPRSTLPVATVPRPVMENTSSTGIKNGLSVSRSGSGMYASTSFISSTILSPHSPSGSSNAFKADPTTIGVSSPGNSYSSNSSRTSISTSSNNSSSSTMSALFKKTMM